MASQGGDELGIEGITDPVRVGQGSFGTVYRANQEAYARTVAVKVLSAPLVEEQSRKAFDRECRALGTISDHPGIVTLYAAGISADNRPYLIMEFLSGGSLSEVLARGPLPWDEAVAIGIKIAGALATAHAAGVLHRDIKPENVLLSAYNEPELADFGVAKVQGGTHTTMGTITGSVAYAAPEVLSGLPATEASDVWSLASTIATLMAGVSPFHRDGEQTLHPLLMRIITAEPNDLRPLGVPEDVHQAIVASLAKNTWERTPSAVAFGEALQEVQRQHGLPVTPLTVRRSPDAAPSGTPSEAPAEMAGEEAETQRRMSPLAGATPPVGPPDSKDPSTARARRWWDREPKDAVEASIPLDQPHPSPPAVAPIPVPPPPVTLPPAPPPPAARLPVSPREEAPPGPSAAVAAGRGEPAPLRPPGPESESRQTRGRGRWLAVGLAAVAAALVVVALVVGRGKSSGAPAARRASATVTTGRPTGTVAPATTTTAPPIRPVFADGLSNPASGWAPDANQEGNGIGSYKPDGYHAIALKPMPALNTFSIASPYAPRFFSLSNTVTATLTGAPTDGAGVRCDQGARLHLRYTFEIHDDASWVVFKIDDAGSSALLQGQSPNVIDTGVHSNLITGTCAEQGVGATKLTFIVNGVTLGTVTDSHPGRIAWHAALVVYRTSPTVMTDARFNSFQTIANND